MLLQHLIFTVENKEHLLTEPYDLKTHGYKLVYQLEQLFSKKPEVDQLTDELLKFVISIPEKLTQEQYKTFSAQLMVFEASVITTEQAESNS